MRRGPGTDAELVERARRRPSRRGRRFMVKQGTLPELGDPPPAKWNFTAWKGDLAIMRLSREENS